LVVGLVVGYEGTGDMLTNGVPQRRQAGRVAKLTRPHFGHLMLFIFDSQVRLFPVPLIKSQQKALIGGERAMPEQSIIAKRVRLARP
jgi:hypothetical protein